MAQSMAQKLQLKTGQPVVLINPPQEMLPFLQSQLPQNPASTADTPTIDAAAIIFLRSRADVQENLPGMLASLTAETLLWLAYPKGGAADINRDSLWELVQPMNLRPVRQIALDATWSALRFRLEPPG